MASRKLGLAVIMVPSMLNSMTACDLLIASAWASASRAFALLRHIVMREPSWVMKTIGAGLAKNAASEPAGSLSWFPCFHGLPNFVLITSDFNDLRRS